MNKIGMLVGLIIIGCLTGYLVYLKRLLKQQDIQAQELDQYTLEVESIYRQMRAIRHDYRNHLQVMTAYLETGDYASLSTYLTTLTNEMNQVDTLIRTGNTLIDSLVNTKLSQAKLNQVQIHATALAPSELAIEQVDLAIILGNLLNNAVEATTQYPHANAFIRVYIAPMQHNLYLSVTNSMQQAPRPNFMSLKGLNRMGYGLHRIDQVVKKYNGIVNRQWEEGVFATEITLPLTK